MTAQSGSEPVRSDDSTERRMKKPYGIAALVIALGLGMTAAVVRRAPAPPRSTPEPLDAFAAPSSPDHPPEHGPAAPEAPQAQEAAASEDAQADDPAAHGQGETAQEAGQYAEARADATQPPQWRAIDAHNEATRGPLQPIPFSHRFHVTDLQIDCQYCHVGTERSASGVVPPMEVCMGCHRIAGSGLPPIEELRGYWERDEPVPWRWVNKLPEFVQFSHRAHLRNAIECAECHGPVEEMHRVYQWAPFTMGWCLECHRRTPAEADVATTAKLVRRNPPLRPPEGRQPHSMYPRAIDSQYGEHRGPIDCASCHY